MSWLDLVENPKIVTSTFADEVPDLSSVELLSVTLDRQVRRALLYLASPSFPSNPPRKWVGSNAVVLQLDFGQVSDLTVTGWTDAATGALAIAGTRDRIEAQYENSDYAISFLAETLSVGYISAYLKE